MIKIRKDLTGKRFGKLVVIKRVEDKIRSENNVRSQWLCQCDCGNTCVVQGTYLLNGNTKSCGCLQQEKCKKLAEHHIKGPNKYEIDGDISYLYIMSKGKEYKCIVDTEDLEKVLQYRWHLSTGNHVTAHIYNNNRRQTVFLHSYILNHNYNKDKIIIDHKNRNGLDNRKANLRLCTHQQNSQNTGKHPNASSYYKGVSFAPNGKHWFAKFQGKKLGATDTPEEAAMLYDAKAREIYGDFACTNFNLDGSLNENIQNNIIKDQALDILFKICFFGDVDNKWNPNSKYICTDAYFTEQDNPQEFQILKQFLELYKKNKGEKNGRFKN